MRFLAWVFASFWLLILALRHIEGWREAAVYVGAYLLCVITSALWGMGIQRDVQGGVS